MDQMAESHYGTENNHNKQTMAEAISSNDLIYAQKLTRFSQTFIGHGLGSPHVSLELVLLGCFCPNELAIRSKVSQIKINLLWVWSNKLGVFGSNTFKHDFRVLLVEPLEQTSSGS